MTKSYELPNGRIFIADIDKSTRICNVTEPQLNILISDLNRYAEMCEHEKEISDKWIDKVKQTREKVQDFVNKCGSDTVAEVNMKSGLAIALEEIDKLIESEE